MHLGDLEAPEAGRAFDISTHCNTLQLIAPLCNSLQHAAPLCNSLQHTATHRNTLQHILGYMYLGDLEAPEAGGALDTSSEEGVGTLCGVLQLSDLWCLDHLKSW